MAVGRDLATWSRQLVGNRPNPEDLMGEYEHVPTDSVTNRTPAAAIGNA